MTEAGVARATARGAALLVGAGLATRALGLAGTLALTHLLDPDAYGAATLAATLVMAASVASALGVGDYVATRGRDDADAPATAALLHLAVGLVALGVAYALRAPLASALHAPGAAALVGPFCVAFAVERAGHIPERVLQRDLRFGAVASLRTASGVAYPVAAVACALAGAGAASIAWGNLARAAVHLVVGALLARAWTWARPSRVGLGSARRMLGFGLPVSGAHALRWASGSWDVPLFARLFGPAAAAAYALASHLASLPHEQVAEPARDAMLPAFARLAPGDRPRAFGAWLVRLSLVVLALTAVLAALTPTAARLVLDARWRAVAPMVAVLALGAVARPALVTASTYLVATARTRAALLVEALCLAAALAGLLWGAARSPLLACVGLSGGFIVAAAAAVVGVVRLDRMGWRRVLLGHGFASRARGVR